MNVKQQQSAETRQKFIDAALELFGEQGYHETSMNAIATRAGFTRANLYLHFPNKAAIVAAKMLEIEPELLDAFLALFTLESKDFTAIRGWLDFMVLRWEEHEVLFEATQFAVASDDATSTAWLDMIHRVARQLPGFADDPQRRQDFIALVMGLDRNFAFLLMRNNRKRYELVLQSLARQWMTLFAR